MWRCSKWIIYAFDFGRKKNNIMKYNKNNRKQRWWAKGKIAGKKSSKENNEQLTMYDDASFWQWTRSMRFWRFSIIRTYLAKSSIKKKTSFKLWTGGQTLYYVCKFSRLMFQWKKKTLLTLTTCSHQVESITVQLTEYLNHPRMMVALAVLICIVRDPISVVI